MQRYRCVRLIAHLPFRIAFPGQDVQHFASHADRNVSRSLGPGLIVHHRCQAFQRDLIAALLRRVPNLKAMFARREGRSTTAKRTCAFTHPPTSTKTSPRQRDFRERKLQAILRLEESLAAFQQRTMELESENNRLKTQLTSAHTELEKLTSLASLLRLIQDNGTGSPRT
jgi:hypothetical protein